MLDIGVMRRVSAQELTAQRAESIQVVRHAWRLAGELLRACAERRARSFGHLVANMRREPEIRELWSSVVREQHVAGLEITVHDAGSVQCSNAGRDAAEHRHELVPRASAKLACVAACAVLEDRVRDIRIVHGETAQHIRVLDRLLQPCTVQECLARRVGDDRRIEHLERVLAATLLVAREPHLGRATCAELMLQHVSRSNDLPAFEHPLDHGATQGLSPPLAGLASAADDEVVAGSPVSFS